MALQWLGVYVSSFCSLQGFFFGGGGGEEFRIWQCHRLLHDRVIWLFMPAAGAEIDLLDCICLPRCREVEIDLYVLLNIVKSTTVG